MNLSNNKLECIPPEMSSMAGLATLDLTSNELIDIPDSMQQLTHLGIICYYLNLIY